MIMVRGADGRVHVLYNRCPHRGVMLVRRPARATPASAFVCSYHAWSFHLDGKLRAIPLAQAATRARA